MKRFVVRAVLGGLCLLGYRRMKHMALWTTEDPQLSKQYHGTARLLLGAAVVIILDGIVEAVLGGSRRSKEGSDA